MIRSAADNIKPPTVVRKMSKTGKNVHVGLFIDNARYYLTPAEAYSLADRLVDAAESVSNET